jgi:hypothetical protein
MSNPYSHRRKGPRFPSHAESFSAFHKKRLNQILKQVQDDNYGL